MTTNFQECGLTFFHKCGLLMIGNFDIEAIAQVQVQEKLHKTHI
jgi:hypothetical protein